MAEDQQPTDPLDTLYDNVTNLGTVSEPPVEKITEKEAQTRNMVANILLSDVDNATCAEDVLVRDLLPHLDLESGADNGWNGTDQQWIQQGLSADQMNETYSVTESGKAENRVIGIYAITNNATTPRTTAIQMRNNSGGKFEHMQVEAMLADQETTVMLVTPLVFRPGESVDIEQWAKSAGDDEIIYHGVTAETTDRVLKGQYE